MTEAGALTRAGAVLLMFAASMTVGHAEVSNATLDKLAGEAARTGNIVWYESTPDDQAAKIVEAFGKRFPNLKLEHVRDTGGNSIGARIVQESQAGARVGDVGTSGAAILLPLIDRNLVRKIDWAGYGLGKDLAPTPYGVRTTAVIYVLLYNTQLVSEAAAPKNWLDLLNPQWDGKIGIWIRGEGQGSLAAVWGEEKTVDFVKKLNALHPVTLKSTFPLAQQIAAGELWVGLGLHHSAQPPIRRGAPIKFVVTDPAATSTLYSFVPAKAANPAGGELVALWLATPEGAKAYEDATDRGNPVLPNTKAHALLAGRTVAEFPPDQADKEAAMVEKMNKLIESGEK